MRFFEDPNFVIMDFRCPYCKQDTTATVHEDGASCCNRCNSEVKPPLTYAEAKKLN